jgi:flagellar basal-body rod protein FlgB
MDLSNITLFKALGQRMKFNSDRNLEVTRNIQNADTPKYQAKELQYKSFRAALSTHSTQLSRTNPNHMTGKTTTSNASFRRQAEKNPVDRKPNGNTVNLQKEHMRLAEIQDNDGMVTRIFKTAQDLVSSALKK